MKIYINGRFLTQKITGVQRYATELVKALDFFLDDIDANTCQYILITPGPIINPIKLRNIMIIQSGIFKGHIWEQFELPFLSFDGALINLCNTGPIFKFNKITSICDASIYAHPDGYSKLFRMFYKILFPLLGLTSKKIITISHFSKNEIAKYCNINENKIIVTHLGVSAKDVAEDYMAIGNLDLLRPFMLTVGSMSPNKNLDRLISAVELLDDPLYRLVVVGGGNNEIFGNLSVKASEKIFRVGYVDDYQLMNLYKNATCFVCPSLYEGFGLPLLEAMDLGCPVVASNVASIPEVCGDAAEYFNPYRISEISEKIKIVMNNLQLRQSMIKRGHERAKIFSWEACAKRTHEICMFSLK